jgi:hypothetical protein
MGSIAKRSRGLVGTLNQDRLLLELLNLLR